MITEIQSSAYDIRDAFYNVVSADPFFAAFTKRKDKMFPVQQRLIPYLGVYLVDEMMAPDGDANAACVRFLHTARIGFSIIVASSTPGVAEQQADQGFMRVMASAYTDLKMLNVLKGMNNNPEGVMIEAIVRGMRRAIYGAPSTDNETPFVEMQYEASCSFRSEWFPDIKDTLDEIDVTTGVKHDDTQVAMDQRQQAAVVYDFVGESGGPPNPPRVVHGFTANPQVPRKPLRRPWLPARQQHRRI